jgi:hypothetical protein
VLNGALVGHALDSAGQPIAGDVAIQGTGAFRYTFTVHAGSDGAFTIPQLLAGPITLTLRAQVGGLTLYGTASGTVVPSEPDVPTAIDVQLQDTGT